MTLDNSKPLSDKVPFYSCSRLENGTIYFCVHKVDMCQDKCLMWNTCLVKDERKEGKCHTIISVVQE